jgi:hypothetical protein
MTLLEYTVTDAGGKTSNKVNNKEVLKGTIVPVTENGVKNPYRFYALNSTNTDGIQVNIVMPLGGEESGLYRFPKVGEKVLVAYNDTNYYLMGYVPSDSNPFNEEKEVIINNIIEKIEKIEKTEDVLDKYGEVFRYKRMGINVDKDKSEYSEIGFYRDKAELPTPELRDSYVESEVKKKIDKIKEKYKPLLAKKQDEAKKKILERDMNEEIKKEESVLYPDLDRINIKSTGDIFSTAANHHDMKAKRFDLKVNDKAASINIDAKGNITINATSISINVGRTSVNIKDGAYTINSKLVNSSLPNSYDAGLKITPRNGFSAFGMNCKLAAVRNLNIGDGMGGSLSTGMGVLSVKGREIKMGTYNAKEYKALEAASVVDLTANIVAAGFHNQIKKTDDKNTKLKKQRKQDITAHVLAWFKWAKKVTDVVLDFFDKLADLKKTRAEAAEREKEVRFKAVGAAYKDDASLKKQAVEAAMIQKLGTSGWNALSEEDKEAALKEELDRMAIENMPGSTPQEKQDAWNNLTKGDQETKRNEQKKTIEEVPIIQRDSEYAGKLDRTAGDDAGRKASGRTPEEWERLSEGERDVFIASAYGGKSTEEKERIQKEYEKNTKYDDSIYRTGGKKNL